MYRNENPATSSQASHPSRKKNMLALQNFHDLYLDVFSNGTRHTAICISAATPVMELSEPVFMG